MATEANSKDFDIDGMTETSRLMAHNLSLRDNIQAVAYIKDCIQGEDNFSAYEAWSLLPEETQEALWVSTKAGGIFSTVERAVLKSDAMAQQMRDYIADQTN